MESYHLLCQSHDICILRTLTKLLFACFIVSVSSWIKNATGEDFHDTFVRGHQNHLWTEDQGLACERGECVYMETYNIDYHKRIGIVFSYKWYHSMTFMMQNNCRHHGCCNEETCTWFTSAQLTSKNTYGYGLFKFFFHSPFRNYHSGTIFC